MRTLQSILLVIALVALMDGPGGADTRAAVAGLRLIVHPTNRAVTLERRFVADAFLKKVTRWPNEELIRPVDLDRASAVRRRFSEDVLKRNVSAIASYWQQQVFSGRGVPPPELDDEAQVVKYVLSNPGAIGYVSGSAAIENARVVELR
jgi:ABC-type phosphate transport system substrate-binding protein